MKPSPRIEDTDLNINGIKAAFILNNSELCKYKFLIYI